MAAGVAVTLTRPQGLIFGVATALAAVLLTGCAGELRDGTATDGAYGAASSARPSGAASRLRKGAVVTLEQYAAAASSQMQGMAGAFGGAYSETGIVPAPPNGIEYVFTYAEPVDSAVAEQGIDVFLPTLRTAFRTVIAPEMRTQVGIAHPRVTIRYLNPDGSTVLSRTLGG